MRSLIIPALLCVLFIHKSCATVHTQCYNYFLQKDGCVFSAADDRNRCSADPKPSTAVGVVQASNTNVKRHTLARRYDTTLPSPSVRGEGICGNYNTAEAEGASLWVGPNPDSTNPEEAGKLAQQGKDIQLQQAITFLQLDPTDEEKEKGSIGSLTWDFNNLNGASPQDGPV
ncbi:hypothetical protein BY996DRAFT_6415114 [Phakopsora pachyrhizi]|nr:hypothetical protein BY996DRAFT_6419989 [Phakopsora pachyrhizi]KAI8452882.1 hypothetical protein BY996DRAFT_6415114 [Phakopsora pachyrhizi]